MHSQRCDRSRKWPDQQGTESDEEQTEAERVERSEEGVCSEAETDSPRRRREIVSREKKGRGRGREADRGAVQGQEEGRYKEREDGDCGADEEQNESHVLE